MQPERTNPLQFGEHTKLSAESLACAYRFADERLRSSNLRRRQLARESLAAERNVELLSIDIEITGLACELCMITEDLHAAGIPEPLTFAAVCAAVELRDLIGLRAALALCNAAGSDFLVVPSEISKAASIAETLQAVDYVAARAGRFADVIVGRFGGEVLNSKGIQKYLMSARGAQLVH